MTPNRKKAAAGFSTRAASNTAFDSQNPKPPFVTGQCAEVLGLIRQYQPVLSFILTGTLHGDPVQRTGQSGKPFTTGKMRADDGGGNAVWASFIAFGNEGERIAGMKDGVALAISGRGVLKVFEGKHGHQASMDVTVDQVATLKAKPRPKREQQPGGDPFADLPGADDLGGGYGG